MTAAEILNALTVCFDPELRLSVTELGMVHGIHLHDDSEAPAFRNQHVEVVLMSRGADEAVESMLTALIANRLLGLEPVSRADVRFEGTWHEGLATPAARRELARRRAGQQGLIQIDLA